MHELTDLPTLIFSAEEDLGVSRTDRPEYQKLTDLQWYYVLSRCQRGALLNKAQWSRDAGVDQSYIYKLQANDRVAAAMGCLSDAKGKLRLNELSDIAFRFAEQGDARWARVYLQMHAVKGADNNAPADTRIDWSAMGKDTVNDDEDLHPPKGN